jgi:hypothetical protein
MDILHDEGLNNFHLSSNTIVMKASGNMIRESNVLRFGDIHKKF